MEGIIRDFKVMHMNSPRQSNLPQPTQFKPELITAVQRSETWDFMKIVKAFNNDSQTALKVLKSQQATSQKAIKDLKLMLELSTKHNLAETIKFKEAELKQRQEIADYRTS
jgi:hypothetical protein